MDLQGRTALITGAARRVGRHIALALSREGMAVAVHFRSSETEAIQTAEEIRAAGGKASLHRGDLADPATPARLVREVESQHGELGLLVNCASIFEEAGFPFDDDHWQRHFDINLTAPMRLIREAAPLLRANGGAVINVADACWDRPTWTRHTAYCVSKAALVALTQNLARTLAPSIRVNAVAPGAIIPPPGATEEERSKAIENVPLKHWGDPDDVARAVVMLARNEFITGQVLALDGGRGAL